MNALVQGFPSSMEGFNFSQHHRSIELRPDQDHIDAEFVQSANGFEDQTIQSNSFSTEESPSDGGDVGEEGDYRDYAVLKYINQMLMEEQDLERKPCMFHDCSALQAAEKAFYDVLGHKYPPSPATLSPPFDSAECGDTNFAGTSSSSCSSTEAINSDGSNWILDQGHFERPNQSAKPILPSNYELSFGPFHVLDSSRENQFGLPTQFPRIDYPPTNILKPKGEDWRGKRNHQREDSEEDEARSNKQLASYAEELADEVFDKVLLCSDELPCLTSNSTPEPEPSSNEAKNKSKGPTRGRPRGKKQEAAKRKEVVDLRSLLTQCAQAVGSYDNRTANELLKRVRQHSSPSGDGTERLAHYFADALEARLAGTGTAFYVARNISAADVLKAYQIYVSSCPFKIMSNIFANKSIKKASKGASTLHIIDFGILYGFQWPCLIQGLSRRPGGPPKLRITGIDLPQPGFRPEGRVEETGNRLANYCRRFNVPFEYNAVAKKWETIELKDLKIEKDEFIAVNCLYRLGTVPDETVVASSPRDVVLNLIRSINPDIFIHGVINGTFNAPFFVTRFREAMFHFSALFDMFDAAAPRESQERIMFEREIFARCAMNVIACEGTERVERPETYKQWQVRNGRAGFRQLPLDQEIVKFVRNKVKLRYHRDFMVDEDGRWMLQGWKGRVVCALSCWKP